MALGTSSIPAERAELEHEQRYVDRVYTRLDELVERATAAEQDGRERGRLGYTGEIKEEDYRTLYERDVLVDHALRRLSVLDAQREGLVFGRLDQTGDVTRYVGRIGIRDDDQEPLVVDWRAPAAAVFYQATPVQTMGVVRRRVLRTRGRQVIGLEDDLLDADAAGDGLTVLGDGALMAALSAARGRQMRDIVSTIQREQDEIIRSPLPGATLITGGPGTGKTVVALHRAAYLLYTHRRRMAGGGVLVVGPSPVFMAYIERVLPSLGENEASLRSVGEVMSGFAATRGDRYDAAVVKGSLRMRTVLARLAREPAPEAPQEFKLYLAGRMLRLDAVQLAGIRKEVLRGSAKPNPARRDAVRMLQTILWQQANEPDPAPVPREDFDAELLDSDEFLEFLDGWWPPRSAAEVFGRLRDRERLARHAKGILRPAEVEALARSWAQTAMVDGAGSGRDTGAETDPGAGTRREPYSIQDIPLLDELHWLLGEPPPPPRVEEDRPVGLDDAEVLEVPTFGGRPAAAGSPTPLSGPPEQYDGYAHVLVDESQDLSPMQWRMLGRRGGRASWTIVGDPAQSAWPDPAEANKAMEAALGRRARRHFTLTTNYRNSAEIFELAGQVIRREILALQLPTAVRRTGVEPEHHLTPPAELAGAVRQAVRALLKTVEGTIGVIATQDRLPDVEDWLSTGALSADAGDTEAGDTGTEDAVADRVTVLSGLASKGLEFDGVVVVEPSGLMKENPVGLRTLYVVLTRATQRLVTVGTDDEWEDPPDPAPAHDAPATQWSEDTLF